MSDWCEDIPRKSLRKPQRCAWCWTLILQGEPAICRTWAESGINHCYFHQECIVAEANDSCYAIPGWLDDGDMCSEAHDRGCTCDETRAKHQEVF